MWCSYLVWYNWETKKLRHASQRQVLYTVIESKFNNLIISLGTHDAATFCFASIEVIKGRMKEMGNTIKTKSNESLLVSDKRALDIYISNYQIFKEIVSLKTKKELLDNEILRSF